jgi:hypothetical protein
MTVGDRDCDEFGSQFFLEFLFYVVHIYVGHKRGDVYREIVLVAQRR